MNFIETIRLEGGRFHLLELHQQRLAATLREVYGGSVCVPDIEAALGSLCDIPDTGIYKCRIVYDTDIREIELLPYSPRTVKTLKAVEADASLDYHLKSCDRTALSALAEQKGNCDEVIIIRNGLVTDTSYTNLVFHSNDRLYTPRLPLLKGVMRQHLLTEGLLTEGLLTEADIRREDLVEGNRFGITGVSLINAMLPLEYAPVIPIGIRIAS